MKVLGWTYPAARVQMHWHNLVRWRLPFIGYRIKAFAQRVFTPWIHQPFDGRSPRSVFVNGEKVRTALYANTRAGFVRYNLEPLRLNRRKDGARWAKKRGTVDVYPI